MDLPLVSIVIPAYNHKQYIEQTVDSCLAQTYPNCEIIVVDDGSTDGTGEILAARYGERIQYIYQQNRGLPAARNAGTDAAKGEYIQYCDSDDQLLPTKVERCVELLQTQADAVFAYTHCDFVEEDGRTVIPRLHSMLPSGDIFCKLLNGPQGNFIMECAPLVRRQAVIEVGRFNESLRAAEDWDLWLRLTARYPVVFLNEVQALYRVRANAMHTDGIRMATARLQVIEMARQYPGREWCIDEAAYDQIVAARYHVLAMEYWKHGQRAASRQAFRQATKLDPAHGKIRLIYGLLTYGFPAQTANIIGQWASRIRSWLHK